MGNRNTTPRWLGVAAWLWIAVSVFYALFALTVAASTAAAVAGLTEGPSTRAAPPVFAAHAVTGALALLAAAVQMGLGTPPSPRRRRLHLAVGRTYVATAAATSLLSVPVVAAFDVDTLTRAGFLGEATLWLATTVTAYVHIRAGRVARHREWMIRSFALAAFFVTFSLWDALTGALPLPPTTAYTLAVFLAWSVNLTAAEVWIRAARTPVVTTRAVVTSAPASPRTSLRRPAGGSRQQWSPDR